MTNRFPGRRLSGPRLPCGPAPCGASAGATRGGRAGRADRPAPEPKGDPRRAAVAGRGRDVRRVRVREARASDHVVVYGLRTGRLYPYRAAYSIGEVCDILRICERHVRMLADLGYIKRCDHYLGLFTLAGIEEMLGRSIGTTRAALRAAGLRIEAEPVARSEARADTAA